MIAPVALRGGFSDPVFQSQAVFRRVLDAFASPGTAIEIESVVTAPAPLHPSVAAFICTFADEGTPVFLNGDRGLCKEAADWIAFHTGAPITPHSDAAEFAIVIAPANMPALEAFSLGSAEYPDRSTTVIVQVEEFRLRPAIRVRGPGIKDVCTIDPHPLPPGFVECMHRNRSLFPRGVDLILASPSHVMVLPRSSHISASAES